MRIRIKRKYCSYVACCCLATISFAGSTRIADGQTQHEMNRQAGKELLKADNELNAVYARLLRASDHASALKLKAAEKAWIAYRDSEAAYESTSNEGGSIYPLVLDKILTDMTEQRTELLKDILRRGNEYLIR